MRSVACSFLLLGCISMFSSSVSAEMIHLFARKGDIEKVMAEVEKGIPIDLPSTRNTTEAGVSPLFVAAKFGHAALVEDLIAAGADFQLFFEAPDGSDPYGTPLHVAAAWGQLDAVQSLIDAGADVDVFHRRIGTPLHKALEAGHDAVASILLTSGAVARVEHAFVEAKVDGADAALAKEVGTGCGGCHQLFETETDPPTIGPSLWNVVGRAKGDVDGFTYSSSMKRDTGFWDLPSLNSYLADPYRYLPGTKMHFAGIQDPKRRAAALRFLLSLSDDPGASK